MRLGPGSGTPPGLQTMVAVVPVIVLLTNVFARLLMRMTHGPAAPPRTLSTRSWSKLIVAVDELVENVLESGSGAVALGSSAEVAKVGREPTVGPRHSRSEENALAGDNSERQRDRRR